MAKKKNGRRYKHVGEPRVFGTLTLGAKLVQIEGQWHELREIDGEQRDSYIVAMQKRQMESRVKAGLPAVADDEDDDHVYDPEDFRGMTSLLLSRTLFRLDPDADPENGDYGDPDKEEAYSEIELQTWPGSILGELFDDAQVLCGLDNKKAKKSQGSKDSG